MMCMKLCTKKGVPTFENEKKKKKRHFESPKIYLSSFENSFARARFIFTITAYERERKRERERKSKKR